MIFKKLLFIGLLSSFSLCHASYTIPEEYYWDSVKTLEEITPERKAAIIKIVEDFRVRFFVYWESLVLHAASRAVLVEHAETWQRIKSYFPFNFPLRKDEKLVIAAVAGGLIPVAPVVRVKQEAGFLTTVFEYLEARKAQKKSAKKRLSNDSFSSVQTQPSSRFSCLLCGNDGISDEEPS